MLAEAIILITDLKTKLGVQKLEVALNFTAAMLSKACQAQTNLKYTKN